MSGKYRHGGPYDRGSADRYYGRPFNPHYYVGTNMLSYERVSERQMTQEELREYAEGWEQETDRNHGNG